MRLNAVARPASEPIERPLQAAVRERLDLAAVVAHQVVMVLTARQQRLVACSVGELEPLYELQANELVEARGNAGQPDPAVPFVASRRSRSRSAAFLASKERDDKLYSARPSAATSSTEEGCARVSFPGSH